VVEVEFPMTNQLSSGPMAWPLNQVRNSESVPIQHKDYTPRTDSGLSTVEVKEYVIAKSCLLPNTAAEMIDRATPDKQYITADGTKSNLSKRGCKIVNEHTVTMLLLGFLEAKDATCAFFNFISHSCIPFTRVIKPSYVPTHYLPRSIFQWKQAEKITKTA